MTRMAARAANDHQMAAQAKAYSVDVNWIHGDMKTTVPHQRAVRLRMSLCC